MSNNIVLGLLCALGVGVWLWQINMRAKERAHSAALRACRRANTQLLDDTVALDGFWLRRNRAGRLRLERRYTFEFTDNGANRSGGLVVMIDGQVEVLAMDGGDLLIP